MKKLNKNRHSFENTVEAYACVCICGCLCDCFCFLTIGSANDVAKTDSSTESGARSKGKDAGIAA